MSSASLSRYTPDATRLISTKAGRAPPTPDAHDPVRGQQRHQDQRVLRPLVRAHRLQQHARIWARGAVRRVDPGMRLTHGVSAPGRSPQHPVGARCRRHSRTAGRRSCSRNAASLAEPFRFARRPVAERRVEQSQVARDAGDVAAVAGAGQDDRAAFGPRLLDQRPRLRAATAASPHRPARRAAPRILTPRAPGQQPPNSTMTNCRTPCRAIFSSASTDTSAGVSVPSRSTTSGTACRPRPAVRASSVRPRCRAAAAPHRSQRRARSAPA